MKTNKKKASYVFPIVLSIYSMILYIAFETGTGFTRLICLYLAATTLLPITLTYLVNLTNSSITQTKPGYTKNRTIKR